MIGPLSLALRFVPWFRTLFGRYWTQIGPKFDYLPKLRGNRNRVKTFPPVSGIAHPDGIIDVPLRTVVPLYSVLNELHWAVAICDSLDTAAQCILLCRLM